MFVSLSFNTDSGPITVYLHRDGVKKDFIVLNNYKYVAYLVTL